MATSAFYCFIPTGVHGPTHTFLVSLTPVSLQRDFWRREDTGETTWHNPELGSSSDEGSSDEDAEGGEEKPRWEEKWSEAHGTPYWVDASSGVSTWTRPADAAGEVNTASRPGEAEALTPDNFEQAFEGRTGPASRRRWTHSDAASCLPFVILRAKYTKRRLEVTPPSAARPRAHPREFRGGLRRHAGAAGAAAGERGRGGLQAEVERGAPGCACLCFERFERPT